MDMIELNPSLSSHQNKTLIRLYSKNTFHTQNLTPRDIIVEFQNQTQLSKSGLQFIFELYSNAFNSSTRVSIILTRVVKIYNLLQSNPYMSNVIVDWNY